MAKQKNTTHENKGWRGDVKGARPGLVRGAYYLTPDLVMRLKIRAAKDQSDLSTTVRAALAEYLKDDGIPGTTRSLTPAPRRTR
jgi:hypothetical protein